MFPPFFKDTKNLIENSDEIIRKITIIQSVTNFNLNGYILDLSKLTINNKLPVNSRNKENPTYGIELYIHFKKDFINFFGFLLIFSFISKFYHNKYFKYIFFLFLLVFILIKQKD